MSFAAADVQTRPWMLYAGTAVVCVAVGLILTTYSVAVALVICAAIVTVAILATPRFAVAGLALFLLFQDPLQILAGRTTEVATYVKRLDEPLIILMAGLCLLRYAEVRRAFVKRGLHVALAGCFLGMILSSIVAHTAPVPSAIDLVLFSKPFLIFALGISLTPSDETVQRMTAPVLAGLLGVLLFSLVFIFNTELHARYLGGLQIIQERLGFITAQGFFIYTVTFAWFAVATFCISFAAYIAYGRRFYLLTCGISGLFALMTWRRKSIIGLVLVLVLALLIRQKKQARARIIVFACLSVLLVVTGLSPYFSALATKTVEEYGSADPYFTARSALYYTSFLIGRDHFPLGTGLASFGSYASVLYYSDVYHEYGLSSIYGLSPRVSFFAMDTFWPMVLGEGGVISLISYLLVFVILGRVSWTASRDLTVSRDVHFLAMATLFLIAASFSESTASHIYGSSLQAALIFLPAGIFWRRYIGSNAGGAAPPADAA